MKTDMNLQSIVSQETSQQETSVPTVYFVTYRQKFGSCFIYRNEIMMSISLNGVYKLAELLLQPGEIISHVKNI